MRNPLRIWCTTVLIIFSVINSWSQVIKLDHVILAVPDIDSAISYVSRLGFKIKPGTIHSNGLKNVHIKFANDTELELMTVTGEPRDEMSRIYKGLLNSGFKGAYLALTGIPLDSLSEMLNQLELSHNIVDGRNWKYLSFPEDSPYAHLFFIEYKTKPQQQQQFYSHTNRAYAIDFVLIEGGDEVEQLFSYLAVDQFSTNGSFYTPTGTIKFVKKPNNKRPLIKSVQFKHKMNWDIVKLMF